MICGGPGRGERVPRSPGSALQSGGLCQATAARWDAHLQGLPSLPPLPWRGWGRTLSRGPALRWRARGRVREGRLAFVTSKRSGGGDRRRSAGREGVFCCPRPGPTHLAHARPSRLAREVPRRASGAEGHRRHRGGGNHLQPCLPPCWPRDAPRLAAPVALPLPGSRGQSRRAAGAESRQG